MNKRTLKMMICDVNDRFSHQLSNLLSQVEFIDLIGNTRSYSETVCLLHYMEPDVILMDVTALPDQPGAIHFIKKQHPGIKLVALTMFHNEIEKTDLTRIGFDAAISRVCDLSQITDELKKLNQGQHPVRSKKLVAA